MQADDHGFTEVLTLTFPTAKAFEAKRNAAYRGFTELIARAKDGGRLRADFSPEDLVLRGLGASHVVDYTGDLSAQVRAIAPAGVPAILHLAGDGEQLAGLLAEGGRIVSTLGYGPDRHAAAVAVMASPDAATLDRLAADVAAGTLRVPITRTYPLAEVPQALADFGTPHHGKLAVTI